jgi:hypothetical protein
LTYVGSVHEVYDRYLRNVERRFPMILAGRIAEQYKQVSPEKAPTEEFRGSHRRNEKRAADEKSAAQYFQSINPPIYESSNSYSPSPFIISIMC